MIHARGGAALRVVALSLLVLGPRAAKAEPGAGLRVAIVAEKPPKKSGVGAVVEGLKAGLGERGLASERPEKRASRDAALRKAGFTHRAELQFTGRGGSWTVSLRRASVDGVELSRASESYAKDDAAKAGRALADRIASQLVPAPVSVPGPALVVAPPSPAPVLAAGPPASAATSDRAGEPSTAQAPVEPSPPEEPPPPAAPATRPSDQDRGAEPALIELGLLGGSQLNTRYSVNVGGTPTKLAYGLSPLPAFGAELSLRIPSTELSVEGQLILALGRFSLGTEPPAVPSDPSATFLGVGGRVAYRLVLAREGARGRSTFALQPVLGLSARSAFVDVQTPTVVVSQTVILPELGLRLLWTPLEALDLGLDVRGRIVASLSESPRVSGTGGSGFGLLVGGRTRYWLTEHVGVGIQVAYHFTQVGLSGAGNRPRFEGDPELVNAQVALGDLEAVAGLMLRF